MREIEFRAWDKINKEMCSVDILDINLKGVSEIEGLRPNKTLAILYAGEFILEQYTGLLDKNGKKIFEGDLLAVKNSIDFIQEMELLGEVIMTPFGAYGITVKDVLKWEKYNVDPPTKEKQIYFINLIGKDYEITGNIHE